jgi:hypothetical protein
MSERSMRPEIRNPILALDTYALLLELPAESRAALRKVLLELSKTAAEKAQKSWRTHKAPMAVYWKAVGVYAKHIANSLTPKVAGNA